MNFREQLADLCHRQWSGWIAYMWTMGSFNDEDGSFTLPSESVERWTRQMSTGYESLSPEEQDSDRAEADKFIEAVAQALAIPITK